LLNKQITNLNGVFSKKHVTIYSNHGIQINIPNINKTPMGATRTELSASQLAQTMAAPMPTGLCAA
jgi:hypothetical protein